MKDFLCITVPDSTSKDTTYDILVCIKTTILAQMQVATTPSNRMVFREPLDIHWGYANKQYGGPELPVSLEGYRFYPVRENLREEELESAKNIEQNLVVCLASNIRRHLEKTVIPMSVVGLDVGEDELTKL